MKQFLKQLLILSIVLSACSNTNYLTERSNKKPDPIPRADKDGDVMFELLNVQPSIWLVDWDYETSIKEADKVLEQLDHLLLFTTYFNEVGELIQTENAIKLFDIIFNKPRYQEKNLYITVVNDRIFADGTSIQKDPSLLEMILETPTSRTQHIDNLLSIADQYPIDGIEIDYEKIPLELMDEFKLFISELNNRMVKSNLSLRVVLEPRFPAEEYQLPSEIKFIVMAYNLYGFGTEPGPKADFEFLDHLIERFPNDNQNIGIALATGGFRWTEGHTTSLTNHDIDLIIKQFNPNLVRDPSSKAISFTFYEDGAENIVWYADETTLMSWSQHLIEQGKYSDISIWRAGGLTNETLTVFEDLINFNN